MKYILSLCILLGASALSAQTDGGGQVEDIIDALQERVPGKGTVTVRGSDALRNMLGKRLHGEGVEKTDSTAFLKIQGYRTQVFGMVRMKCLQVLKTCSIGLPSVSKFSR